VSVRRGKEGEFTEVESGGYSLTVSTEEEAARTGGRGRVFLVADGVTDSEDGWETVALGMTGDEARELARDLLLAADLLG
jgi:hypothetical protein